MRFRTLVLAGAMALAATMSAWAAGAVDLFQNGGFNNQAGVSGWILTDPGNTVSYDSWNHYPNNNGNQAPNFSWNRREGDLMLVMSPGQEPDVAAQISQTFRVDTRSLLSGWAAFIGNDYILGQDGDLDEDGFTDISPDCDPQLAMCLPLYPAGSYNDYAYVTVDGVENPLFHASIGAEGFEDVVGNIVVGNWGWTPWTQFSLYLDPGVYTLRLGIANGTDGYNASQLIADNISVAAVPEPTTWAMMIGGFFGLGAMIRRRKAALA